MTASLAACPMCGSDKSKVHPLTFGTMAYVRCCSCGACGEGATVEQDAIDAWNRRAPIAPPVEAIVMVNSQGTTTGRSLHLFEAVSDGFDFYRDTDNVVMIWTRHNSSIEWHPATPKPEGADLCPPA